MRFWFAVQVDRDYKTHDYGGGTRLYIDSSINYKIVKGVSYENDVLIVKDEDGTLITLDNEPNNLLFENSIHLDWTKWDKKFGENDPENRSDYEPWAYASKKALALELNLYKLKKGEQINNYYKKDI